MPVGAIAKHVNNTLVLFGMVASLNGKRIVKESITGAPENAKILGEKLAEKILQKSAPWYTQPD